MHDRVNAIEAGTAGDVRAGVGSVVRIGLVLTVVMVAIGSLNFARYDWSGLPLHRTPTTAVREVGTDCTERIRPYTTESGREVGPIVVDEQQYLNLVERYRGVPRSDLQLACLYGPFAFRSATPWMAHLLPLEEGLALGITVSAMTVAGLWLVLFALRAQGFSARVILVTGAIVAVSWNVLLFGSGLLIDSSVVAAIALCWLLLALRRPWLVWPVLLVGYPFKETIGIVVPVLAAWAWTEHRDRGKPLAAAFSPAVAGAVAFGAGVLMWHRLLPTPDATWPMTPDPGIVVSNLTDAVGLVGLVLGAGPFLVPAYGELRRELHRSGPAVVATDPAVVGVLMAIGVTSWSLVAGDLTPRLFWIGVPFAATLVARWFSDGRPRVWLDRAERFRLRSGSPA